jgi:hypothetical protein
MEASISEELQGLQDHEVARLPRVPLPAELPQAPAGSPSLDGLKLSRALHTQGSCIRFLRGNPQLFVSAGIVECTSVVDEDLILRVSLHHCIKDARVRVSILFRM